MSSWRGDDGDDGDHEAPETSRRSPLRVVLDTSFAGANRTGVGLYSRELARALRSLQSQVGLTLTCFGPSCQEGQPGALATLQEWPLYTQGILPILASARRPDIVHSTSHLGPLWGRGRLIVTVHDLIFRRYPSDYNPVWLAITVRMLPRVLARASAVIADSAATGADLERFYSVARGKIKVIYPGVNAEFRGRVPSETIRRVKQKMRVGPGPYIICLGPWVKRKNLGVVVEAYARLAREFPDLRLVITGSVARGMQASPLAESLRRLPADVARGVRLVGYVSSAELRAMVQGAALLAYPSLYEGFGLPPIEAMSAGVPVVASDTPAVVEATGGAAMIARREEPADWERAFRQVLEHPDKAEALRAAGLSRSKLFSWERCAQETATLYRVVSEQYLNSSPA